MADILPKKQPKQNAAPMGEEYELSPEQEAQISNYVDNAKILIHKAPGNDRIIHELKRIKNPQAAVAATAVLVHELLTKQMNDNQKQFNTVTLFYGSSALVTELIELGEAAGIFKMSEEQKYASLQLAIQHYLGKGLKEGWIDPVGLQKEVEPLMPESMRKKGWEIYNKSKGPVSREVPQ